MKCIHFTEKIFRSIKKVLKSLLFLYESLNTSGRDIKKYNIGKFLGGLVSRLVYFSVSSVYYPFFMYLVG